MWNFASNCIAGAHATPKKNPSKQRQDTTIECSDDEASSIASKDDEEGLECPICCESFNLVENIPYVLWCGHTLCKNCILALQWAVVKFPTLPLQLPLFISCPWCNLLSFRLVYKGTLKFPRKNFFLLWMLESMNGDRAKSQPSICGDDQAIWASNAKPATRVSAGNYLSGVGHRYYEPSVGSRHDWLSVERLQSFLRRSLELFVHLTAKLPLVIIFLLIILYAVPASAAVLALYVVITVFFAVPSFLILYFSYPSLDWLVREIIT